MRYRAINIVFFLFLVRSNVSCRPVRKLSHGDDVDSSGDGEKRGSKLWLKLHGDEENGSGGDAEGDEDVISGDASTPVPDANCERMLDIAFLLDASESIGPVGFRMIKWYSKEILDKLDLTDCDNTAIIKFTDFTVSEIFLGTNTKANILERLDELREPRKLVEAEVNKSRVDLALLVADELVFRTELGSRNMSKKYVVLMTDGKQPGHDSSNRSLAFESLVKRLSEKGIHILVLAIGEDPSIEELVKMTTEEENIFPERRFNELINVLVPMDGHPNAFDQMPTDFYVSDEPRYADENTFTFED